MTLSWWHIGGIAAALIVFATVILALDVRGAVRYERKMDAAYPDGRRGERGPFTEATRTVLLAAEARAMREDPEGFLNRER